MHLSPNRDQARHIAILVRSLAGGGEQSRMVSLAAAFARAGRHVTVYVPRLAAGADSGIPPGVMVYAVDGSPAGVWSRRGYIRAIADALLRDPPDLLFSSGAASCLAVAAGCKAMLPQLPLVVRASSHPCRRIPWRRMRHRLLEPVRRTLRRRRFRAADLIIAVGQDVATAVRAMAPDVPLVVLPDPVITAKFLAELKGPPPEHPWLHDEIPIVLAAGRLSVAKDFPTLLRAFALVRSRRELRLVVLGDGLPRYRQELVDLAHELGIDKDVAFPGWADNIAGWMAWASVLVSTSMWEGSPGVIIEALAAGRPIVATDCLGDTRHLLQDGELGVLAPVGDFRALAHLIEKQLDNPREPEALKIAATPYREELAAKAYLQTLDAFAAAFAHRRARCR